MPEISPQIKLLKILNENLLDLGKIINNKLENNKIAFEINNYNKIVNKSFDEIKK